MQKGEKNHAQIDKRTEKLTMNKMEKQKLSRESFRLKYLQNSHMLYVSI